eukprot:Awhi_evm1s487
MAMRRNSRPLTPDVEQGGNTIDGLNNAVDRENMTHGVVTKIEGVTEQANKAADTLIKAANIEN